MAVPYVCSRSGDALSIELTRGSDQASSCEHVKVQRSPLSQRHCCQCISLLCPSLGFRVVDWYV